MSALADLEDLTLPRPAWFERALEVPRKSEHVEVEGCPIHALSWGEPGKPGLLFVHGFLAHARCFAFIAPFLAEEHHVVACDLSGFGDSGYRDSYADGVRARELRALADHFGMQRPTFVAHSYGATVAMDALERFPEAFAGLVLCDVLMMRPEPLLAFRKRSAITAKQRKPPPRRVYPDLAAGMERFRLAPPQPVEEPYLFEYLARHSLEPCEGGWTWKFHPSSFALDARDDTFWLEQPERFVRLAHRKVAIYGERSLLFNRHTVAYLRELGGTGIPMLGVPEAGHHLMLDQPLAFVTAIRAALTLLGGVPA
ncbi:MAG: alpha/beta hydrolase [Myxococcota bacterium]